MPVNSTHPDYDASAVDWSRARDVLAGEDAVKAGGEKYLPRLDSQTDEEFAAYVERASYFNASARTSEAYLGLMFRRPPFVKLPEGGAGVGRALKTFENDADMLGTSLAGYAKRVVGDVVGVGRAGSLVDWEAAAEQRAYVSFYRAEQIKVFYGNLWCRNARSCRGCVRQKRTSREKTRSVSGRRWCSMTSTSCSTVSGLRPRSWNSSVSVRCRTLMCLATARPAAVSVKPRYLS